MKIKNILRAIEALVPIAIQEEFDNCGIQVGNADNELTGAILCLDITEAVVDEAAAKNCNLIISHYPLAFKPFRSLTGCTRTERCIIKACRHNIVIYSAHTNLDNAYGGLNFFLSQQIGLSDVRILSPKKNMLLKLAVFVPESYVEAVRTALFDAGAGHIGRYDSCSFSTHGEGSFRAGYDCRPFCGEAGKLHFEREARIETIVPSFLKNTVVKALLNAHPYEEPAYDIYPLKNSWYGAGSGVIGILPEDEDHKTFLLYIKQRFDVSCLKHSTLTSLKVRKVAICGGSGSFLLHEAAAAGADVLITGEAKYNDYYDATDAGILLAVVGHYETEWVAVDLLASLISKKIPIFAQHFSNVNFNPVKYI
jgi:dinuclear metal center YbgI/SA1388 family protein